MIRINLLGGGRQKARKAPAFDAGRQMALVCGLILVAALGGNGWWFWSLSTESDRLDAEIASAQAEAARLRAVLDDVQAFEARRTQLQQRVSLIEELRRGQSVPVQLLDHVSRSLPEMLWLTAFQRDGDAVTLEGRSTTLIALSDFVGNLGTSALLQKPIEIVNSQVENLPAAAGQPATDIIRFTVRAQLAPAAPRAVGAAPARGQGPGPAGAPGVAG